MSGACSAGVLIGVTLPVPSRTLCGVATGGLPIGAISTLSGNSGDDSGTGDTGDDSGTGDDSDTGDADRDAADTGDGTGESRGVSRTVHIRGSPSTGATLIISRPGTYSTTWCR